MFLRTKFICIIWTFICIGSPNSCSWGLSLFVLFEPNATEVGGKESSWGLSLFVLFEPLVTHYENGHSSWGLSLFVLFEHSYVLPIVLLVLED